MLSLTSTETFALTTNAELGAGSLVETGSESDSEVFVFEEVFRRWINTFSPPRQLIGAGSVPSTAAALGEGRTHKPQKVFHTQKSGASLKRETTGEQMNS